ncbi:MAG: FAD:protein FMN transferase [Duodenibacillus sp.]
MLSLSAGLLFFVPSESVQAAPDNGTVTVYEADVAALTMGTIVNARLYAPSQETADKLADAFEDRLHAMVQMLTVHGEGPLNDVNRRHGEWVNVDCRIADLVERAKDVARASKGAFEPTIGPLASVWKIGFGGTRRPDDSAIAAARAKVDWRRIQTEHPESGRCRVRIGRDQSLDLGAIAKGWMGTELVREMRALGAVSGIIDLGGNIALLGSNPSGRAWNVGIQDPTAERGVPLASLTASEVSVITSGAYERKMVENKTGKTYGHILSAVTGEPVATDLSSVSIVSEDGAYADAWCTAFFAMGRDKALERMRTDKAMQAILVSADEKTLWVSESLARRMKFLNTAIKVIVVPRD